MSNKSKTKRTRDNNNPYNSFAWGSLAPHKFLLLGGSLAPPPILLCGGPLAPPEFASGRWGDRPPRLTDQRATTSNTERSVAARDARCGRIATWHLAASGKVPSTVAARFYHSSVYHGKTDRKVVKPSGILVPLLGPSTRKW